MHQNGLSYLIIELEDSGQPVQGIQPKNNNKGNPQMFGKRLSTLCSSGIWLRMLLARDFFNLGILSRVIIQVGRYNNVTVLMLRPLGGTPPPLQLEYHISS